MTVVALHGFLGHSSDWRRVREALPLLNWLVPDYVSEPSLSPERVSLERWGEAFHQWLIARVKGPVVLVGYSQGARLALHALERNPSSFSKVIFISARPGLPELEKPARLVIDESWAKRFEADPWSDVLKAWNAQPVFGGGIEEPVRLESLEARRSAAACLRAWSVANQKDFVPLLKDHREKVILVAGERDLKYLELTKALAEEGLDVRIARNSGHRVLFDAPTALASVISSAFS